MDDILLFGCSVFEDLANVLDVETTIDMLTDHNYRSKTAGAHAAQAVEREFAVAKARQRPTTALPSPTSKASSTKCH